jgi:hypothetical protein
MTYDRARYGIGPRQPGAHLPFGKVIVDARSNASACKGSVHQGITALSPLIPAAPDP